MLDLSQYSPEHASELEALWRGPAWCDVLDSGLLGSVRAERLEPGQNRDYVDTVVDQLLDLNEPRLAVLIGEGNRDREELLEALGTWPDDLGGKKPLLSFLGFNVASECNFDPRCAYCNQPEITDVAGPDAWKKVIADVAANNGDEGVYIYLTGGEPLLLEERIWGDDGLVAFAARRGAAVNINTNATLLTPEVALRLIKAGLVRLHISLDAADPEVQNPLFGGDRLGTVLEGIYNVQLARELVGVDYPEIHTNCVLTNRNLDRFPELFRFILNKRKQVTGPDIPLANDLFPHVIPVGGESNLELRPSAQGFRRFYEEIWPEVGHIWQQHQAALGVPEDQRRVLFGYFSNPFLRVGHRGGLDAYVEASVDGRYGELALTRHCYVAPTQSCFTSDGSQFRCGSHAIRRLQPIGHVHRGDVFENIRNGISGLADLPQEEHCYGCALATLYINQSVETRLEERLEALLKSAAAE